MTDVVVAYEYAAQADDELTLKVGDVITGTIKVTDGWSEGTLHGRKGMFPDNFVRPIAPAAAAAVVKDRPAPSLPSSSSAAPGKSVAAPRQQKPGANPSGGGAGVSELRNKLGGIIGNAPPGVAARGGGRSGRGSKKARVTNPYAPQASDELMLEVGTVIEILKQEEEGWWEGNINGKIGMFPSNFVEVIDEAGSTGGVGGGSDSGDKTPTDTPEIKGRKVEGVGFGNIFGSGPIVLRSAKNPPAAGGVESRAAPDGARPAEHRLSVKLKVPIPPSAAVRTTPDETTTKPVYPRAKVLYVYDAANDDELSMSEGNIITVLDQDLEDKGWWKGELNGKVGVFPDNFVELLPVPTPVEEKPKKPPMPAIPPNASKPALITPTDPTPSNNPLRGAPAPITKKEELKPTISNTGVNKPVVWGAGGGGGERKIAKIPPDTKPGATATDDKVLKTGGGPTVADGGGAHGVVAGKLSGGGGISRPGGGRPSVDSSAEFKHQGSTTPASPTGAKGFPSRLAGDAADSKSAMVTQEQYAELQREVIALRESIEQTRKSQDKRFLDLMGEIDEEKKTRLSLQVEIERLKKYVTTID